MAAYLAMRIEMGKMNYNKIVKLLPKYKETIDEILALDGYEVQEDGTVKKA